MQSGLMRDKIEIKRKSSTKDAVGQKTLETSVAEVWAERRQLSSKERFSGERDLGATTVKFIIYYRTDIAEDCWIIFESQRYDIIGIVEIGYKEGLEILTELKK